MNTFTLASEDLRRSLCNKSIYFLVVCPLLKITFLLSSWSFGFSFIYWALYAQDYELDLLSQYPLMKPKPRNSRGKKGKDQEIPLGIGSGIEEDGHT